MISSESTVSPAVEELLRLGVLEALSRPRGMTRDKRLTLSAAETMPAEAPWWQGRIGDIQNLTSRIIRTVNRTEVSGDNLTIAASRVLAATRPDEIAAALSIGRRGAVAERIRDLQEMVDESASEEPSIEQRSLRELALFLLSQRQLVDPQIGISPDGLLLAEWASAQRGIVAMKFHPDGIIHYAAVSPAGGDGLRLRSHGEQPKDLALAAVRAFLPVPSGEVARHAPA